MFVSVIRCVKIATARLVIMARLDAHHQRIVENIREPKQEMEMLPKSTNLKEALFLQIASSSFDPKKQKISDYVRYLEDLFNRSQEAGKEWPDDNRRSMLWWKLRESRPDIQILNRLKDDAEGASYSQLKMMRRQHEK